MSEHLMAGEQPAPNVIEALRRVMRDLPSIGKDAKADPKQGGYSYRGIDQITPHTQRLFAEHGVVFVPHVVAWEVRDITVNDKPWTDTYELVEYTVYGPGGADDHIKVGPILAIGRDNSDKGANKCMTQAYKYALLQTLSVSDAKDDGDQASVEAEHTRPRRTAVEGITSADLFERLTQLIASKVVDPDGEHAKAAWKQAKPKAADGVIPEDEQARVLGVAEQYVADLREMHGEATQEEAERQEELL